MNKLTVGSICSGIEAASVAWRRLNYKFKWFSEIGEFPSKVLSHHYPNIPNLGDINNLSSKIISNEVDAPDLICGGTPCQSFSMNGLRKGLNDNRGNLTIKFIDIINANDVVRLKQHKQPTIAFWENVMGVLSDRTNAFGYFISTLAGLDDVIELSSFPNAGILYGKTRNIAWRVLDSKYFGIPQQRKRVYLLAGGKDFYPENILFDYTDTTPPKHPKYNLIFEKHNHLFEIFKEYTDCLCASFGTRWAGNSAARNGTLFVSQDGKLRRMSPLECERLMGFPDNYTNVGDRRNCPQKRGDTNRYVAIGNSWSIPVIKWIGNRILKYSTNTIGLHHNIKVNQVSGVKLSDKSYYIDLTNSIFNIGSNFYINSSYAPHDFSFGDLRNIVTHNNVHDNYYISIKAFKSIMRRLNSRDLNINPRLKMYYNQFA